MNFLEYLISIYDNRDKEENLEKRIPFLELEYWYKKYNKNMYCQIIIINEKEEVLMTIGEDIENIYGNLDFIINENGYIKLWISGVKFGKVTNFEKYFKYNKEDEAFYEFNFQKQKQ